MAASRASAIRSRAATATHAGLRLFSLPVCVATLFVTLSCGYAAAQELSPAVWADMPVEWLAIVITCVGLAALVGLAVGLVTIWDKVFRPRPALHLQFAAIDHEHAEYVRNKSYKERHLSCARERMEIRQEMGNAVGKVERQIDHLRNAVTTQSDQVMSAIMSMDDKQEERASKIHGRIDPLAERIAANSQAIDQHLSDERAKGNGGH